MAAALLALAACSGSDAKAAARAVREYDDELVRAFRMSDASRMATFATRKEADRVLVIVDLKASNRLVLESTLERFDVVSSKASADGKSAAVETKERWRYFDRPIAPGRSPGPTIVSEMRMRYDLVRESRRWKVADVTTLENVFLEPKGGPARGGHEAPQR
jgi:hypothetical protein